MKGQGSNWQRKRERWNDRGGEIERDGETKRERERENEGDREREGGG